jgi:hypothetical protein
MKDHLEVEEFLLMGNLKRKEVEYFKTTWVDRWVVLVPDKFLVYGKRGMSLVYAIVVVVVFFFFFADLSLVSLNLLSVRHEVFSSMCSFSLSDSAGDAVPLKSIAINTDTLVSPDEDLSGYADTFVIKQRDRATGKENKKATEYFKAEDASMSLVVCLCLFIYFHLFFTNVLYDSMEYYFIFVACIYHLISLSHCQVTWRAGSKRF